MRVWLEKRQKKEAKSTIKIATPPAEAVSEAADAFPSGDSADRPVESIEKATRPEDFTDHAATVPVDGGGEATQRAGSAATQLNEVRKYSRRKASF
jgi:hypothetical protein